MIYETSRVSRLLRGKQISCLHAICCEGFAKNTVSLSLNYIPVFEGIMFSVFAFQPFKFALTSLSVQETGRTHNCKLMYCWFA